MDPISIGLGVGQAALSFFGSNQQDLATISAQAYQTKLAQRQAEIMNAAQNRAYARLLENASRQLGENFAEANSTYSTNQAQFQEQLLSFAFAKESMLRNAQQVEGVANATESYGKTADRMKAVKALGDVGRQEAKFAESVASAYAQSERTNQRLFDNQLRQANQGIIEQVGNRPMPQFVPGDYQAPKPQGNTLLKIGQAALSGLETAQRFDPLFDFSSPAPAPASFGSGSFAIGQAAQTIAF